MHEIGPDRRQFLKIGTAVGGGLVLPVANVSTAGAASAKVPATVVTAFLGNVRQADFRGLGVHFSPFESDLTETQWALVHERLAFMRPSVLRVMLGAGWYTKGFDAAGRPVFDWDSADMRKLYFMLDWAERNGAEVIIGDWGPPSGEPLKLGPTDPRWTALVGELLHHLFETKKYTCLKYYNLHNEPNLWFPDYGEFEPWKTSILNLHAELKRRGLLDRIMIIGPDSTEPDDVISTTADWLSGRSESWVVKTVESIKETIGAYDVHKYEYVYNVERGDLEQRLWSQRQYLDNRDTAAKPFMVTEAGMDRGLDVPELGIHNPDTQKDRYGFVYGVQMADYAIQVMRAGGAGVLAWDLDDAQHFGGAYGSRNLKGWGFWNSLGGQDGYPVSDRDVRPWFYTWSLLSRCFPRGSRTLHVPATGHAGVRVTAARLPGDGLSVALVNHADRGRSIALRLPDLAPGARLHEYRYFDKDRPADAKGFPVPKRTVDAADVTVDLPARGVVVLTTLGTGTTARPAGATTTFVDDLTDLAKVHAHSPGLVIDTTNPGYFAGDSARLKRTALGAQWVAYHRPGLTSFALTAYKVSAVFGRITAAVSSDGKAWKAVDLASSPVYKVDALQDWHGAVLTPAAPLPAGTAYVRIQLDGDLRVFSPQLAKVSLNYRI